MNETTLKVSDAYDFMLSNFCDPPVILAALQSMATLSSPEP